MVLLIARFHRRHIFLTAFLRILVAHHDIYDGVTERPQIDNLLNLHKLFLLFLDLLILNAPVKKLKFWVIIELPNGFMDRPRLEIDDEEVIWNRFLLVFFGLVFRKS